MELRWLEYQEEAYPTIAPHEVQYGKTYDKILVTKRKLQYRVFQNTAVYAGMPDQNFINQHAKMAWSDWRDVPVVKDPT